MHDFQALDNHTCVQVIEEESALPKPGWSRNTKLGRFTNFVNLLDMCGVAIPSGTVQYDPAAATAPAAALMTGSGGSGSGPVTLPFGVTLLAAGWQDEWLWGVAASLHRASGLGCGPAGHGVHAK